MFEIVSDKGNIRIAPEEKLFAALHNSSSSQSTVASPPAPRYTKDGKVRVTVNHYVRVT